MKNRTQIDQTGVCLCDPVISVIGFISSEGFHHCLSWHWVVLAFIALWTFVSAPSSEGVGLLCEKGGSGHVLGLVACRMGQAYQPCTVKDVFWSSLPTVSVMVSEQCLCLRSAAVSSALDKRGELIPSRLSYPSWDSALLISPWDLKLERCWWDISALPGILVTL